MDNLTRKKYATDLSDIEWKILTPLVPKAKYGGRPEKYPKREIMNAVRYVVRTGCQWRNLPNDFPPWESVYYYFRRWRLDGVWKRIHDRLRGDVRESEGRQRQPSAAIIDSQSVKTTEKGGLAGMMQARKSKGASATSWSMFLASC
jgi:putative transposase